MFWLADFKMLVNRVTWLSWDIVWLLIYQCWTGKD